MSDTTEILNQLEKNIKRDIVLRIAEKIFVNSLTAHGTEGAKIIASPEECLKAGEIWVEAQLKYCEENK